MQLAQKVEVPAWLHIVLLTAGCGYCGWWLAAMEATWPIWLGCYLAIAYLLTVGRGGIVLASIWITSLIVLIVWLGIYPNFWFERTPYRYWAKVLLMLWGSGTLMTYLLAIKGQALKAGQTVQQRRLRLVYFGLLCLGLGAGQLFFALGTAS